MTDLANPEWPFRAWIQRCAKLLKRKIPDLLALARNNDPFLIGGEEEIKKGRWFAELWKVIESPRDIHLRSMHYALLHSNVRLLDGTPYENTEEQWELLQIASKCGRVLRMVPAEAFVDRRNPPPILPAWIQHLDEDIARVQPQILLPSEFEFRLPSIAMIGTYLLPDMSAPSVDGYQEDDYSDRPFYSEIWIEKSTQNHILVPLCERLGVGLVTAVGIQSISNAIQFLMRVQRLRKPGRIFYVSDFDPAGDGMPVSVARHLEFWRRFYAPESDVALTPLALTLQQVRDYNLPRTPIKKGDLRRAGFESDYGEGAVELDALEGLRRSRRLRILGSALHHTR